MKLLIGTKNQGKLTEIRQFLTPAAVDLLDLSAVGPVNEVPETGETFAENARIKAAGYAKQAGMYALADDSGLEIAALGGAPGVLSARYGGQNIGYPEKMKLVLEQLGGTSENERGAHFVCVMAIAAPDGKILHSTEGICEGNIAFEPRGTGGFGYDPIFIPRGFEGTFGELDRGIKEQISHRARAISGIMRFLLDFTHV
jgi:XTP/dITP diphosphohydrolase